MVITVTVDNAKSNDVALDYLKKKLEMTDGYMLGGRFLHMRCVAQILNLIVQQGLKGIHNSIVKVRTTVRLCGIDGDPLLKEMAQSTKEKYEKYWGDFENMNLMMFIAVVLDPRYKMKYLKYWFNKWYSKEMAEFALKLVRDALDKL
ncbi:hypothetical protein SO802_019568 [Lithocarpus litseifolius]|uniref:hAT-like transposase RNase-H fold domain-containing protein n=1 Tax=Lithocarpus litseifolius TaxID=425828 RepID=A0AAW2CP38_9ROSI